MRDLPAGAADVLNGSRTGDRLTVHAWYDGAVVAADLDVAEWSWTEDATRQVRGTLELSVVDADNTLAPWSYGDPLAPGGARLQTVYELPGGHAVPFGWQSITGAEPAESWRVYRSPDGFGGTVLTWTAGGGMVPVTGEDLTEVAVADRLLAPDSPDTGGTVLSEVSRLLDGVIPVVVAEGVTDRTVPASTVYERDRMDAVEDLLGMIGCSHRMTGDGMLQVVPTGEQDPVWTVTGGDEGALVSVVRTLDARDIYNGVVSTSQTDDGAELVGRSFEDSGALVWEGPAWRRPMFHEAIATSQAGVTQDAATTLANRVRGRQIVLTVECLPHPGVQVFDWVTVAAPVVDGTVVPLTGQVVSVAMRGSRAGVSPMVLGVACDYARVQAVAGRVRRGVR